MSLPRTAVRRPVTMTMISVVIILLGAVALVRLPVDLMPDVTFPSLSLTVAYPDVGPLEMEELVTRPLPFSGARLLANLQASGGGSLQVEVLDADGRALDDYASDPLIGDSVALEWRPQQGLRRLAGRPVRLRLRLRACSLYALQFAD